MKGAQGKPVLVIGQRGEARVALLLSDHAWLWARGYEGGGPYTDLLRRLAHWLMKEPDLEEETLKATSRGQTLSIERRSVKDKVDQVTVTAPSGKEEPVTLDKGGDLAAVTATDEALSPVVDETGGGSFWLGRDDAEAAKLPRLVMLRGGHVMHGDDWLGLPKAGGPSCKGRGLV